MKTYPIKPLQSVSGIVQVPPDKSISHRALMFSSLSKEETRIYPFLRSDDTCSTLECIRRLGTSAKTLPDGTLRVKGCGLYFPKKRKTVLCAGESGTTMRILSGILCAQKFPVRFTASPSLARRPMQRIIAPLTAMEADIKGRARRGSADRYPPLTITPVPRLKGINVTLPVASAQVKSALLFASLYAQGPLTVREPHASRDHTERMMLQYGTTLTQRGNCIRSFPCKGSSLSSPGTLFIPGDFSSAAFFIVLSLLHPKARLIIRDVSLNPTRTGLITVLRRMGGHILLRNKRGVHEPYGDIIVQSSTLNATTVAPHEIPLMIDEIPVLCVAASFANGTTTIEGVEELAVKETNRIISIKENLRRANVKVTVTRSGPRLTMTVKGTKRRAPSSFKSFGDHRTAMSMIVFALAGNVSCTIDDIRCIHKSFPGFIPAIESLR